MYIPAKHHDHLQASQLVVTAPVVNILRTRTGSSAGYPNRGEEGILSSIY
jgi:hypothetical protein